MARIPTRRRSRVALLFTAPLAIGALALAQPALGQTGPVSAPAAPAAVGGQPGLVSSLILADGSEQEIFSNGATFVGTPGTTVTFATVSDGTDVGGYSMSVTPPDPDTGGGALAMAQAYEAAGRSPARDARDLGLAPT